MFKTDNKRSKTSNLRSSGDKKRKMPLHGKHAWFHIRALTRVENESESGRFGGKKRSSGRRRTNSFAKSNRKSEYNTNRAIIGSMGLSRFATMESCQNTRVTRDLGSGFSQWAPYLLFPPSGSNSLWAFFEKIRNHTSFPRIGLEFRLRLLRNSNKNESDTRDYFKCRIRAEIRPRTVDKCSERELDELARGSRWVNERFLAQFGTCAPIFFSHFCPMIYRRRERRSELILKIKFPFLYFALSFLICLNLITNFGFCILRKREMKFRFGTPLFSDRQRGSVREKRDSDTRYALCVCVCSRKEARGEAVRSRGAC